MDKIDFQEHAPIDFQEHTTEPSSLEALGRGALQGGTLGFGDEIGGGAYALKDAVSKGSVSDFVKDYIKNRDEIRSNNEKARSAHPYLYGTGEIGGSILPTIATGVGIPALAGLGATSAVGHSNSSDPMELAKDAAIGGGTAAIAGKAIETAAPYVAKGASKVGNYIADKLGTGAEDLAAVHLGSGATTDMGRAALDADAIKLGGKVGDTAKNLGSAVSDAATEDIPSGLVEGPFKNFPPKPGTPLLHPAGPDIGGLEAAQSIAEKTAAKPEGFTSDLIDKGMQGTGLISLAHGNPWPLVAYGGRALTKGRIASSGAVALDAASSGLKSLVDSNLLDATQVSRIASTPYAALFKNAAANGPHAVAMTHYVLQQTDPQYQQLLKQN